VATEPPTRRRPPAGTSATVLDVGSAKAVGHMAALSRCASSLKPSVAYLVVNFWAL
jgi:hypothetical protein